VSFCILIIIMGNFVSALLFLSLLYDHMTFETFLIFFSSIHGMIRTMIIITTPPSGMPCRNQCKIPCISSSVSSNSLTETEDFFSCNHAGMAKTRSKSNMIHGDAVSRYHYHCDCGLLFVVGSPPLCFAAIVVFVRCSVFLRCSL
jgi:hypothetical protein